jgi:endonuclease/exonuclease/phosphatase family metal-dependent hydrolase
MAILNFKRSKLNSRDFTRPLLVFILVVSLFAGISSYIIANSKAADEYTPFKYKVASYNVLGSGANAAPRFNRQHNVNTHDRMKNAITVMRNFDIIGAQELDYYKENRFKNNQFEMFKEQLMGTYNMYPKNSPVSTNRSLNFDKESLRAIFWKQNRFNLVSTGAIAYPYQDAPRKANGEFERNDRAPWVLLEDKDDPRVKFYVINMHMIAFNNDRCRWNCNPPNERGGSDSAGDQKRKEAAQILRQWIINTKQKHPVMVTGDFNSGFTLRRARDTRPRPVVERQTGLPYCILTGGGVIRNTRDAYLNRSGACPTNSEKEWLIDHVYATQSFKVENWGRVSNTYTAKASDHRPTYAVMTLTPPPTADESAEPTNYTDISPAGVETSESDSLELLNE